MSYYDKATRRWRFRYTGDNGEHRCHTGYVSKRLADAEQGRLKERRRLITSGGLTPQTEAARDLLARPIATVVADYIAHKLKAGMSAKSAETLGGRLQLVLPMGGIERISDINATSTVAALDAYAKARKVAQRTVHDALTGIRQMLKHYEIAPDPTAAVKLPKITALERERRAATPQEIGALREAARRPAASRNASRWWPVDREALIVLVVATGMRRGDMIGMKVSDLVLTGTQPRVIGRAGSSKNREPFVQPLALEAAAWLRAWVGTKPPTATLFPSLTEHSRVSQIIKRCCDHAGIQYRDKDGRYLDGHSLRHTYGTMLGQSGADIRTVMELMRHKNLATTQRYMHTTDDLKRDAVNRMGGAT